MADNETPETAPSSDETPPTTQAASATVTEREEPIPKSAATHGGEEEKEEVVVVEGKNPTHQEQTKVAPSHPPESLVSFKEESNRVADLSDSEKNALQQLKQLVQEALNNNQFTTSEPPTTLSSSASDSTTTPPQVSAVSLWGIPLLEDDRSDVILLKFLRARDFHVKDAFVMINNTLKWRKNFGIDSLLHQDLGCDDLDKVVFMHGIDREGHPVCYNVYGEFQNKDLYHKAFSDQEKRTQFLRWRIQFLERSIRNLDFSGVCTVFQVNDLKNSPGPAKRELRIATKQALQLLQDNYPEFVSKQVFINVPWWYIAFYTMISPFLTQRTKSKFVFVGPSRTAETLFKYIAPEHVPVQYGGLSVDYCDCNPEFSITDPATEITVKPATKQIVEIIIYEKCIIVWELRVVGWDVSYGTEFVPNAEDGYTVVIQKTTKMAPTDEPVVSNSFKVTELGKLLLTIDNPTSKKKNLLYRFKIKTF